MRRISIGLILIFICAYAIVKCTNSEPPKVVNLPCRDIKLELPSGYKEKKLYTLVFLDFTEKTIMGEKSIARLRKLISESLISPKDRIDIYVINPNTAVQTTPYTLTLSIDDRGDIIIGAKIDSIMKNKRYACNRLLALDTIIRKVDKELLKQQLSMDSTESLNTDVAGLFHIADLAWSNPNLKDFTKALHIFSDLEHNCPGYFGISSRFSSNGNFAISNVEKDFEILSGKVNLQNFKGAKVSYFMGDRKMQPDFGDALNKMIHYWEDLFEKMGLTLINAY